MVTTSEAEAAVAEWLQAMFGQSAVSHTDAKTGKVTVSIYLAKRADWERVSRAALVAGLQRIRHCGLKIGPARVTCQIVRSQDWAESWKRHFKPIDVGSALLIKPSWSKRRPQTGQALIVLDPGLSFGTGQHPTTSFCLQQLVAFRNSGRRQVFLDIGTGSGILAIAAAKLGYSPVDAFDSDSEAVRIARGNARRNRVAARIRVQQVDLTKTARRSTRGYDVVCANLVANLLLSERKRIACRVKSGGALVLAGILKEEFPRISRAYAREGFKLVASRTENEWCSGAFVSFKVQALACLRR